MHTTSLSLLERVKSRTDHASWDRFVRLYTPLLFFWAKRNGLEPQAAEDFVQELFVLLLDKLSRYEHRGTGSFRGWLRTIAVNKCQERFRKRQVVGVGGDNGDLQALAAAEVDPFWEVDYRRHLVARALEIMQAEFEPATWQACWLRVVEDLPAAEVARRLGLKEASVHVYSGRVLRRLREELQDLLE